MKNIALITVLFDYPNSYTPLFYKNALNFFDKNDIHVIRHNNLFKGDSYYDKLYFYKVVMLLEYIKNNIINNYDYILFLDATDTNFYSSPKDIVDKFKEKNCSIIMGAEKCLWPPNSFTHLYNKKNITSEYKYLNSGTYFGYVDKIIFHLEKIIKEVYDTGIDDQGKWSIEYLLHDDILIDYNCEFFMSSLNSKKNIELNNNKVKINGYDPIIVHDNGPFNEDTIKIADKL